MRKILSTLILLFSIGSAYSQQNFYIFLQIENGKPFYIKHKAKVYSSSPNGYLILPKLANGTQVIRLGFPKSNEAEIPFQINVSNKDLGYKITTTNEKISLLNLVDFSQIFSGEEKKDDVVVKQELMPTKDSSSNKMVLVPKEVEIKTVDTTKIEVKQESIKNLSTIQLYKRFQNDKGVELIYVVKENGKEDTIAILVPSIQNSGVKVIDTLATKEIPKAQKADENIFLNFEGKPTNNDTLTKQTQIQIPNTDTIVRVSLINTDCKKIADNTDYLNLRKKIAGEDDTEKMMTIVAKAFKQKCYTTEQIKNISVLFLSDESKFNFFQAAYPYIYDSSNFKSLGSELKNEVELAKFNQMIKK